MHPAPSVILFTVLSGLGFGFLAHLGAGLVPVSGWVAFIAWGLGYALAVGGLLSSTFHLGHPERAWRAFSQWRSSWLSREGVAAVVTLIVLAPMALSDWLGLGLPRAIGLLGAALALITIFTTSMIYAQLKTVPRWNHWITPVLFQAFALAGGAMLSDHRLWAGLMLLVLGAAIVASWGIGDKAFAKRGVTMESAVGVGDLGKVSVFEQPHSHPNYLMREMIHHVGRKHAAKLRAIALTFGVALPLIVLILPFMLAPIVAVVLHLIGAFAQRWLFFAQAEHVVGLYYGRKFDS